jgi:hypothetical protein
VAHVLPVDRDHVEGDESSGCFLREARNSRGGRVQSQLKSVEVEPARSRDHDLTVDDATIGQAAQEGVVQLGKVAVERPQLAALNEDIRAATEHDGPKSVPLRLVQEGAIDRELFRQLGEHRLERRIDGKSSWRHDKSVARETDILLTIGAWFESIPPDWTNRGVNAARPSALAATLLRERERAFLFRDLATLRTDIALFESADDLRWMGPMPAFAPLAKRLDAAVIQYQAGTV